MAKSKLPLLLLAGAGVAALMLGKKEVKTGNDLIDSGELLDGSGWRIMQSRVRPDWYFVDVERGGAWVTIGVMGSYSAFNSAADARSVIAKIESGEIVIGPDGMASPGG